jgi:hypothetical protein
MIQYAAPFVLDHQRPGVLDGRAKPDDDSYGMGDQ